MSRYFGTFLAIVAVAVFLTACAIHSEYRTRSFMSEDELREIETMYHPSSEEPQAPEPFLADFNGPAIRVNGLDIDAKDIRDLYEYYASFRDESPADLKTAACEQWIITYAIMSQWPDTIDATVARLVDIRGKADTGTDFTGLIIENSQEPDADRTGGDLGDVHRGQAVPIFEMHAFSDPIGRVSGPFPTRAGWHLIRVLSRNTENAEDPTAHVSHLLLMHGLNPENARTINENVVRWTSLAQIELLAPELDDLLPRYAVRRQPAQEDIPAEPPIED